MSLLSAEPIFKPFHYPWAYDAWKMQQQIHWLPEEVPMADDVQDWKKKAYRAREASFNANIQILYPGGHRS